MLVLAICCMSLLIVGMDNTIVNVALPSIARSLHGTLSGLQWTIDAYTVVLAGLLILSGSMGDRLGRKRTFMTGLVIFVVASLLCSAAPSLGWLVAFRMLQAIGGSMLNPIAMSIITNVFTDPRERARAIGVWGGVVGLSLGLGPIVGGALTEAVGWQAIFWINAPIGLAAFVLTAIFVPESRAVRPRRVDPAGQVLVMALLGALTFAIIESPRSGWGSPAVLIPLAVAAACLFGLFGYEPRRAEPLIDFRFFRSVPFTGATLTAVCAFGGFSGFLFLNTLYLQDVRGLSPLHAGALTAPMALMVLIGAPAAGRHVGSHGPRLSLVSSGIGIVVAALLIVDLTTSTSYALLIASYIVFGIGFGLVNPPITNAAVSGMPRSQAGVAAAFASTSRQVGAALGVAVIGSLVNPGTGGQIGAGLVARSHVAEAVVACCGVAVVLLGMLTTTAWARRSAERTAAELGDANVESAPDRTEVAAA